jgi:hypothetical protein
MAIRLEDWVGPIQREYLSTFIPAGGGAVRFVVADDETLLVAQERLTAMARANGLAIISIDTAMMRLHMLHLLFFAVAGSLDWEGLIQTRLEILAGKAGYRWEEPGTRMTLPRLAEANDIALPVVRRTLQQEVTRTVWQDARLAQDFRKAMMALLDARLADDPDSPGDAVLGWLQGKLRSLREVRDAQIGARIGRHNARAMLMSLCHWLRTCGHPGLVVFLDIRRLLRERKEISEGVAYTPAAVMDCYEVLRQMIDDSELFEGLFLMVLANARLLNDDVPRRALSQYTALKMRVVDDVRPRGQDNPLSPLVVIAP